MRIAVTGGTGKLGRAVVADLKDADHEVINLDAAALRPDIQIDLTDYGQTIEALTAIDDRYDSIDAVVHLAAIPAPGITGNAATFRNNIVATYNVFAAAKAAGITNVVWASSETLLGIPFDSPPPYIALDEEYPARPEARSAVGKHLEDT